MKIYQLITAFIGILLISCGEGNRNNLVNDQENGDDQSIYENRQDVTDNLGDTTRFDTARMEYNRNDNINSNLPQKITSKIQQVDSLKNKRIVNSRRIDRQNKVYYEVDFRNGARSTTVTFDEDGNEARNIN